MPYFMHTFSALEKRLFFGTSPERAADFLSPFQDSRSSQT